MLDFTKSYEASYSKTYDQGFRNYMLMIYSYIAIGLAITGLSGFLAINTPLSHLFYEISESGRFIGIRPITGFISFAPLFIGLYFFWGFSRMSIETAKIWFWAYAFCMGISASNLGLIYTGQSIVKTFFITSASFAGISIYGYTTKRDLSSYSGLLMAGIVSLLCASLLNFLLRSSGLQFAISLMGVLVFMGMIAWDTQKIKHIYFSAPLGIANRYAIVAAFNLYLNFVNLFFYLIRFTGEDRNK